MTDNLNEIVLQAQAGELAAFDKLITRYQDFAFATALRFLGERADAQDATQNAFIEAYYSLSKLRNPLAFGAWLRRIVLKHCDRQIRGKQPQFVSLDELVLQDGQTSLQPYAILEKLQFDHAIHSAVANLPVIYRAIADGYYLQNHSLTELAHAHDLSYTTTKKRLFTARKLLKARILTMSTITIEDAKVSDNFSDRIRFFIAVRKNELTTVRKILHRSPELVHEVAQWDAGSYGYYAVLGATALHWAVGRGNLPMAKLLRLEFSADINASNERIAPPLTTAVQMCRPDLVTWLLEQGADVNKQSQQGQTALHAAVIRRQPELLATLLEAGGDRSLADAHGRTPLDWAVLKQFTQGIALLEGAGMINSAESAPPFTPSTQTIWETGIKIIDAMTPLTLGGSNALLTPIPGIGLDLMLASLMGSFIDNMGGTVVIIGETRSGFEVENRLLEWRNLGVDRALDLFYSGPTAETAAHFQQPIKLGVKKADEHSQNQPVLLIAYTHALTVTGAMELLKPIEANQAITLLFVSNQSIGALSPALAQIDSAITFDLWRRKQQLQPAIDPVRSTVKQYENAEHAEIAQAARRLLARYIDLDIIYHSQGFAGFDMPIFDPQDKLDAMRARLLHHYLCQRLPLTETWTAIPGEYVSLSDTLATIRQILDGEMDWADEKKVQDFGRFDPALS